MTPEGRIKKQIDTCLASAKRLYSFMPVPWGMGETTLDYLGCCNGRFFVIEAKRPGKEPTGRQQRVASEVWMAGAPAFHVCDDATLADFATWLAWADAQPPLIMGPLGTAGRLGERATAFFAAMEG